MALGALAVGSPHAALAQTDPAGQEAAPVSQPASSTNQRFDIDEFRVDGADKLPQIEVEEAVYPFLGPKRNADDVEKARAALEKAYHDKGFQTVSVAVPAQNVASRVVVLKVVEGKVGRLRVTNSRYFDVDRIKKQASSLKEGTLPNFNEVTKDIVALNQWSDRRITPALRAGVTPGTVDVDLNVEDKFPLHASVEVNNRQSPNTTATRVNATVKYDNLWQLGHSLSASYQIAPQRPEDAQVLSGSYLARVTDWTSVLVYGVDSKSDVATIGGMNVVGPGQILGGRVVMTLPTRDNFFHSLSLGVDYKHFGQTVNLGTDTFSTPITYYPANASYGATWQNEGALTQLNLGFTFNLRGPGSQFDDYWNKRAFADSNFFHFNADLSHTHDLPEGFQLFGRVKGQVSDGPQISSEQFSLGGVDTVRGYLESETIGDNGIAGTLEIRSPDFGPMLQSHIKDETGQGPARFTTFNEWRVFGFVDAGHATIYRPLEEQQSRFDMWSYGVGTRFKLFDYLQGMVALAVPMVSQGETGAKDPRVLFSASGEF
ncbi:ShlB/FhaC/HecB family hemolysin secretion/activation protein [Bradyrhizobium sp. LHD-71]|nr:ShlB/FhaC/HecB family hemolysin secretion/activation protein [Bradyrhizobium sp. LHD-71]MDQ8728093.1 ShlB/FhaC/HecB family hemolysin secretion/activation protein [Bradyrhizobium sp. LHD-71]